MSFGTYDTAVTATCTIVTVSGVGILDGTYGDVPTTLYDDYYYKPGGFEYYYAYNDDGEWWISSSDFSIQYRVRLVLLPYTLDICGGRF